MNSIGGLESGLKIFIVILSTHIYIQTHSPLFQIPDVVYKLTSLTTLYLRFNRIREVGEEIANLKVNSLLNLFLNMGKSKYNFSSLSFI